MQDLYATTFLLAAPDHRDPLLMAIQRTEQWLRRRLPDGAALTELGTGESRTADGVEARWAHHRDESGEREAFDLVMEHPDDQEPDDRWRAAVVLTRTGRTCRATVRVSRGSTRHELRPRRFSVAPPMIVSELLTPPLRGYAGALELAKRPLRLKAEDIDAFISEQLRHPDRALPIVVCDIGATLPDTPNALASRLVGLAHVVVLHSAEAWQRLRDRLPEDYVPYGGARIYWPGFGLATAGVIRHPYFTRRELRERPLARRLSRWLRELAVSQVPRDRLPDRLRLEALRSRATAPVQPPPPTDADQQRAAAVLAERLAEVAADRDEWQLLATEADERANDLEDENEQLKTDLATLRQNLDAISRYQPTVAGDEEDEAPEVPAADVPEAWGEEFEQAVRDLSGPALAFTPRALECARRNAYRRPADMYAAIVGLEKVARRYHEGNGRLGTGLVDFARRFTGTVIALQDDTYTSTAFEYEGRQLDRLPHVKVDDHTAPSEVGRIYFALDTDRARFVVDWFGVKRDRPAN